jgi:hypothetical protein
LPWHREIREAPPLRLAPAQVLLVAREPAIVWEWGRGSLQGVKAVLFPVLGLAVEVERGRGESAPGPVPRR